MSSTQSVKNMILLFTTILDTHICHRLQTVQNMIWEEYDFLVYHYFEDYDLGRIRSYRARMQTVCILLIFVLICVDMLHKAAS